MKKLLALLFALALLPSDTLGQAVQQSGLVTPGHVVKWLTTGVIGDGGTAANGGLTSLGVTNAGGPGICVNSGPITGAYNALCMSASTAAAGRITLQNYGGAAAQNLQFCTNGNCLTVPASGGSGTIPSIITPTITNETICAVDIAGNLGGCPAGSAHGMPFYTTSQILASTAAMTNGQIVVGQTGGDPTPRSLSGDVSTISSTGAVTITKVNGVPFPATYTANLPLIGNGTGLIAQGTRSGNTTSFATTTGTLTNGNCVSIDASGNLVAAGGACTTSGGGGTVSSGTANQLAYYASSGSTVVGLTSANSGLLVTSGAGVPSISTAIPNGVTATTQTLTDSSTKVATTAFVPKPVGSAGAIQMAGGSSVFADSTMSMVTPGGGSTGSYLQLPVLAATGGGSVIFGNFAGSSYTQNGHEFIGCYGCTVNAGAAGGTAFVGTDGSTNAIIGNTAGDSFHLTAIGVSVNCQTANGVCVGHGATALNPSDIVIGTASDTGTAGGDIIIGAGADTSSNGNHVLIGGPLTAAGTANSNILIAPRSSPSCTVTSINEAIGIGYGACPTATGNVVVGGSIAAAFYAGTESSQVPGYFKTIIYQGGPLTKTANYSPNIGDNTVTFNCVGTCTAALGNVQIIGYKLRIHTIAAQLVNAGGSNVVPLDGSAAGSAILTATAGKWADLEFDGTNWQITAGN